MTDPIWVTAFRVVHISAGFMAFFLAPAALITAKGGKQHRRWGKIYFWMMAVVALTALVLSVYRPIPFLTLVAVFSFYMHSVDTACSSANVRSRDRGPPCSIGSAASWYCWRVRL